MGRLAAARLSSARATSSQRAVAAARIAPQVFAGFAAARACRHDCEMAVRASKLAEPPACRRFARHSDSERSRELLTGDSCERSVVNAAGGS